MSKIVENNDKYIKEKWGGKPMKTPKAKKGMWKGWSLDDLKKERQRLKAIKGKTPAESTRLKEVNFALRAKTGWGKVPEQRSYTMNKIVEKINRVLNEGKKITGKEKKRIKIDRYSQQKGYLKTKISLGIGDLPDIKPNAKPVKGKNKFDVAAGTIKKIIGDFVLLDAGEEGEFWYKASDLRYPQD